MTDLDESHSNSDLVHDSYHTPPAILTPVKTNPFEPSDSEEGGSATLIKWQVVPNASVLQAEVQFLKEKLIAKEEKHAMELEECKERQTKQSQTIEKLQNKVIQYKEQCQELQKKLDNISANKGISQSQLPSAVRQLEAKVKELEKQRDEMEKCHATEMQDIILDNNRQTHRALQLSASNTSLVKQLEDALETIYQLKTQLTSEQDKLMKENDKMEQDKNYFSDLKTVRSKANVLREELEKIKQDTSNEVQLLRDSLNTVGNKLKLEINKEQQSYRYLQSQVSSDMQQKENQLVKVSTELISLQKDHSVQEQTYKELIEELELEVDSLKLGQEEMERKTREELNSQEEQLANLRKEKDELDGQFKNNKQVLKEMVHSIASTVRNEDKEVSLDEMFGHDHTAIEEMSQWILTTVNERLRAQKCQIEKLQSQLVLSQTSCNELKTRLKEEEMKEEQHYSATDVMKRELNLCQSQLKELSQNKKTLELQIEDIVGQKMEVDTRLTGWQESLAQLEKERSSTAQAHTALEKTIKEMELEIKEIQNDKNSLEAEVNKKKQVVSRLQQQIIESRSEIQHLQTKLSALKTEQVDMERHVFETKTKMESLELEKQLLEKELVDVQSSEQSLLKRMIEFQQVNSILQSEKRALQHSLDNLTANQSILDRKNTQLANEKAAQDDVIDALRLTNNELTDKVDELDKNLQEMESMRTRLRREKSGLKQETVLLNEAFTKTRQALSEVQLQRGQLNNSVAKIAQEKAVLVHEKLQLASNIAHLEGSLKSSLQTIAVLSSEKESMNKRLNELGNKCSETETKTLELEEMMVSLRKEKERESLRLKEEYDTMKNSLVMELEKSKQEGVKLRDEIQLKGSSHARTVANLKKSQQIETAKLKNDHSHEIMLLVSNHDTTVKKFKSEIKSLKDECDKDKTRISNEKSLIISSLEKEKAVLVERLQTQQNVSEERCTELEQERQEGEIQINELKIQLKESERNSEVLSKELNYIEGQIQKLQTVLEQVRVDAESEISSLQTDLINSATKIVELEEKNSDNLLAIKHHEGNTNSLKTQLKEAQEILDRENNERESLKSEVQSLEQKLVQVQSQYSKACETMSCFEKLVEESREEKTQNVNESRRLRKLLQFSEQALAKLTEEHHKLETLYTKSQKDLNNVGVQFESLQKERDELYSSSKEYKLKHADLQSRLKIVTLGFDTKQEDLKNTLEIVEKLRKENKQLNTCLEECQNEGKELSDDLTSLMSKFEELKAQRGDLMSTVQVFEACLDKEKKTSESLRQEMAAVKISKNQAENEFKQMGSAYQELHLTHNKFLSILEGTLEPQLIESVLSERKREEQRSADEVDKERDRRVEYLTLRNDSCESGLGQVESSDHVIMIASPPPPSPLPPPSSPFPPSPLPPPPSPFPLLLPPSPSPLLSTNVNSMQSIQNPDMLVQFIAKLQNSVLMLQKSNHDLSCELEHAKSRLEQFITQKEQLSVQLEECKRAYKEQVQILQTITSDKDQLEGTVKSQNEEIKTLKIKIEESIRAEKRMNDELQLGQVKTQAALAQLKQTSEVQLAQEVEKKEIQSQLNKVKLNEMLYENELTRLKKEKEKWSLLDAKKEKKIIELQEELRTSQILQTKMDTDFKECKVQLEESIKKRDEFWTVLKGQRQKEMEFEKEIQSLLTRSIQCEQMLKNQMEETSLMKTKSKEVVKELQNEISLLKQKLQTSEVTKTNLEGTLSSLKRKTEELTKNKTQTQTESIEMRREMDKRIVSLQFSLDAERANSQASKELQQSLAEKLQEREKELRGVQTERNELSQKLESSKTNAEHVDGLLLKQAQLTNSLVASSKLNTELSQQLQLKDEMHKKAVLELQAMQRRDRDVSRIGQKLYQTQFEGKETEYKKLVSQLERKVNLLDDQLSHIKSSRDQLVTKTHKQDKAIAKFHKVLSHSDLLDYEDHHNIITTPSLLTKEI